MTAGARPELWLRRFKQNAYATYGWLVDAAGVRVCATLELPWNANAHDVSCIPAGTYTAERYFSPDHKRVVFRLVDVPDRGYIELHNGALPSDSKGCILLGHDFGFVDYGDGRSGDGITLSRSTFAAFMANHPEQRFTLHLQDLAA